jgi:HrpA-like RNA helicase
MYKRKKLSNKKPNNKSNKYILHENKIENNLDNVGILDPDGINNNPLTNLPYSDKYKELARLWKLYPAYHKAKTIIKDITNNQVILVIAGTGGGKTVLTPKFALHALNYTGKIAITLPKISSTRMAAEFSALTLDVKLGEQVGYKYKGSDRRKYSSKNNLLYATDGTIVAKLINDPSLSDFDAVIIDEAHERKVQIDFLLYLLRNTLKLRPEFKLIIMSATIDASIFVKYFNNFKFKTIEIGAGTNFPITTTYLEKSISSKEYMRYGLEIIKKIENTTEYGDILFFVPSVAETHTVCELVRSDDKLGYCIELYSGISKEKEDSALDKSIYKTLTNKNRKIVIATNIAESSVTVDGIKYVIDSGYENFSGYDPLLNAKVLNMQLITQAQSIQRRGRTGRTEAGEFYPLYTRDDFEHKMKKFPDPSIKTSNLYEECVSFLHMPNIRTVDNLLDVFSNFIDPPSTRYINSALSLLTRLNIIDDDNKITRLGDIVGELNMDPMEAIAIILGYKLKCAKELCALFCMLSEMKNNMKDLFMKPNQKDKQKTNKYELARKRLVHEQGDHLTILLIFQKYRLLKKEQQDKKLNSWLYDNFIKKNILDKANKNYQKMKEQIHQVLSRDKILDDLFEFEDKIEDLGKKTLEHRIMLCILYGFRTNIADIKAKRQTPSRDSFMNLLNYNKYNDDVVYQELFMRNGRIEANIVSKIFPNILLSYKKIF